MTSRTEFIRAIELANRDLSHILDNFDDTLVEAVEEGEIAPDEERQIAAVLDGMQETLDDMMVIRDILLERE